MLHGYSRQCRTIGSFSATLGLLALNYYIIGLNAVDVIVGIMFNLGFSHF